MLCRIQQHAFFCCTLHIVPVRLTRCFGERAHRLSHLQFVQRARKVEVECKVLQDACVPDEHGVTQ